MQFRICKTCNKKEEFKNYEKITDIVYPEMVNCDFCDKKMLEMILIKNANGEINPLDALVCFKCSKKKKYNIIINVRQSYNDKCYSCKMEFDKGMLVRKRIEELN